jgi:heat shock protein HslJ
MLLVAVLGTAGCSGSGSNTHVLDATAWHPSAWQVTSLHPGGFTITATFTNGKIAGKSAVNAYDGPYTAGPGAAFSVGNLAVTAMGGIGPDMRAEQIYLTLLGAATSFKRSDARLTLFDQYGNESLIFRAATP